MWRKFWHQVGLGSLPNPCQAMWWSSHWCILKGRIRRDLSTWAQGWKALPWKHSRRVCRRTTIMNLGLQNVSSVSTFPKKEQFYFIFYSLPQYNYLSLLQEQVSPLVQLRTFLSAAPCMRKFRGCHTPSFSNPFYFVPFLMSIRSGGGNFDDMKTVSLCKCLTLEGPLTFH